MIRVSDIQLGGISAIGVVFIILSIIWGVLAVSDIITSRCVGITRRQWKFIIIAIAFAIMGIVI
jgi:hypothetical protein